VDCHIVHDKIQARILHLLHIPSVEHVTDISKLCISMAKHQIRKLWNVK